MKIFNWVHRKFHHNADYYLISQKKDGYVNNVKKAETAMNDSHTEALLDQINLVDVLDGWKDGILTIGTFGFEPLKSSHPQNEYSVEEEYSVTGEEEDENAEEEEEGELHPLVVKAFKKEIGKSLGSDAGSDVGKSTNVDDIPLLRFLESPEIKNDSDYSDKKNKKEGRTTLADLFSADPEVTGKSDPGVLKLNSGEKPVQSTSNGRSFTKKLTSRKGEDSRPIRKLHRLITKMLKKKIHPDLDGKVQGMDGQIGALPYDLSDDGAIESISLLQIQDAVNGL